MENRTEILNELQSLSPTLAGLQGLNVYTVPNGYFDVLSEDILHTIQLAQYGIINSAQKKILQMYPKVILKIWQILF